MFSENWFHAPLSAPAQLELQTCAPGPGGMQVLNTITSTGHCTDNALQAKDFTQYLIFINCYMAGLILLYLTCFTTDLKRAKVSLAARLEHSPVLQVNEAATLTASCDSEETEQLKSDQENLSV